MPSQKFKNKQRLKQVCSSQRCPCHMKYEFNASCLTSTNAAKIAEAFPEISFLVDTSQADSVSLRLDDQQFFYRYAAPEFQPFSIFAGEDFATEMLDAVMHDVEKVEKNLVDLLFAATHHDPHWLATPEAQQVAGAFSASHFIQSRFHARMEEIASALPTILVEAPPAAETVK